MFNFGNKMESFYASSFPFRNKKENRLLTIELFVQLAESISLILD